MRMPALGPRDRRAILIGAAVLVPAFAWTFAAAPYLAAVADARDRLALERRLLRGELELLASASAYPQAFDAGAERLLAAAPRLMAGDDEGAAAAALAGYVRRLAQMGTANLTRVEPAASYDAGGGVRALPVGVTGETDLEGLLTFLQVLESGPKLVDVQELRLEASSGSSAGGTPYGGAPAFYTPAAAPPEVITFRFTAVAFTLAAPADSAAGEVDPPADDAGAVELRDAEEGGAP